MAVTPPADRVPVGTKIAYGIGAVAYGIKDNGFSVFLLLFYNQVVGLPAATVGAVVAIALVFDALIDPLLGIASDRTRTRWGRRHPWLYASALPIGLSWLMLWHPPQGDAQTVLGWLLLSAILARAALATNEVPSLSLAPELTSDYHERTLTIRYRFLFGWIGGLTILMLAYGVFLAPPRATVGPGAREGYHLYAMFGAAAMVLSVLISALGTHRRVVGRALPPVAQQSAGELFRGLGETLKNRAFVVLMLSGIFAYTNQFIGFGLSNYNLQFTWQFGPRELVIYSLSLIAAAGVAFALVGPAQQALGKRWAAALLGFLGMFFCILPFALRLLDLFPPAGTATLLYTYVTVNALGVALGIAAMIVSVSMMSDVVEASQEMTGRREEGLFFSGALLMQKCASGIGILITGLILSAAAFPQGAQVGGVPDAVIDRMTLLAIVAAFVIQGVASLVILRFPFGEAEHDARVAKLAAQRG